MADSWISEPFTREQILQFHAHIQAYAEILFRWQLLEKRLELLKSVPPRRNGLTDPVQHRMGMSLQSIACTEP